MAATSFTARIDAELKVQLDLIAQFEDRSASYIANQAIRAFVEERMASRELIETGLALVDQEAPSLATSSVHEWLRAEGKHPFPKHDQ